MLAFYQFSIYASTVFKKLQKNFSKTVALSGKNAYNGLINREGRA